MKKLFLFILTMSMTVLCAWSQTKVTLPDGSTDYVYDIGEGNIKIVNYKLCGICSGTKVCTYCFGRCGRSIGNVWYNCSFCKGRGFCGNCGGKGEKETIWYYNSQKGTVMLYDPVSGNSYMTNVQASAPSTQNRYTDDGRRICNMCNGTGRQRIPIPCPVDVYKHCSECDQNMTMASYHIHQSCSVCYGRGTVK